MGHPGTAIPGQRALNQIGVREEKTSTEIPQVVASERGGGQTRGH